MNQGKWGVMLQAAALRFAIPPADFWKLSLWEWQQLNAVQLPDHVTKIDLKNLVKQYPDKLVRDAIDE